ncbi:MAG: HlyC/CorC family transporter [Chthonomonas sp.]|nr:HlyC/CorC family transporter [Chthonomonas sp.]
MGSGGSWQWFVSILLVLSNAMFVAAEYGLVGARRSRIESLAKAGSRSARILLAEMANTPRYIASIQIAITMVGIGMGAITEPVFTEAISGWLGSSVNRGVSVACSLVLVTFVMVVVGELVPKYVSLQHAERVAVVTIVPLKVFTTALSPLVWLVQVSGRGILKLIRVEANPDNAKLSKEELMLLVRSGTSEGALEEEHASVVSKALRFDELDADDVMIHRLDMKWLSLETPKESLLVEMAKCGHSRVPVCREDLDDIVGILYANDLLRHWGDADFELEKHLRPVEVVPENLSLNRIVSRMRESRTHLVIVVDEYGGTSGLITLEDVVEEVFGEMDDQVEAERPAIEKVAERRISMRADVRYDELLEFLGREDDSSDISTDTLAQVMIDQLGRMAKLGDSVATELGTLRVENMARRRITRIGLQLVRDEDS